MPLWGAGEGTSETERFSKGRYDDKEIMEGVQCADVTQV
jgi:hypothetical protein